MKTVLAAAMLTFLIAGCSGTDEERAAKRAIAMELAVDRIERFNAMGIDPVQLTDRQLLILDTACVVVILGGVEYGLDAETVKTISATCEIIKKAAAEAVVPEVKDPA